LKVRGVKKTIRGVFLLSTCLAFGLCLASRLTLAEEFHYIPSEQPWTGEYTGVCKNLERLLRKAAVICMALDAKPPSFFCSSGLVDHSKKEMVDGSIDIFVQKWAREVSCLERVVREGEEGVFVYRTRKLMLGIKKDIEGVLRAIRRETGHRLCAMDLDLAEMDLDLAEADLRRLPK